MPTRAISLEEVGFSTVKLIIHYEEFVAQKDARIAELEAVCAALNAELNAKEAGHEDAPPLVETAPGKADGG